MQTWQETLRLAFSPDGSDTAHDIPDEHLASAISATGNLLAAAELLTQAHGRIIAREDIARRVQASPKLTALLEIAREVCMLRAVGRAQQVIARQRVDRQRKVAEWHRLHQERMHEAALRYVRNHSRCGAKTRTGAPCKRRPELGKGRCRNHGGWSTGPRTPEGRARCPCARPTASTLTAPN
jgi:hypothetical protein